MIDKQKAIAALDAPAGAAEGGVIVERLSDTAIAIINDLHTERLDYQSEYLPLIDAANRLAAYEATGLEPCDYAAMRAALEQDDRARQDLNDLLHIVGAAGIDHLRDLVQAEKTGRLVVLPFPHGKILLDRSNPQKPELLKNFRVAISYDHCGIVFHQPLGIFMENVKCGYITEVSRGAEAAMDARKGDAQC